MFDLTVIHRGLPSDGGAPFVGARLAPPGTKGKARAARTAPACGTVRALTPTPGVQGVPAPASTSRVVHAAAGAGFTDLGSRLEAWAGKGVPSMAPPPFLQPLWAAVKGRQGNGPSCFRRDMREAARAVDWLQTGQYGARLWRALLSRARVPSPEQVGQDLAYRLMLAGHGKVGKARLALQAYERFVASIAGDLRDPDPHPADESLLVRSLVTRTLESRQAHSRRVARLSASGAAEAAPTWRGTTGGNQLKGLAFAAELFGAPFPEELRKAKCVRLAALPPRDVAAAIKQRAHFPPDVAVRVALLAEGGDPSVPAAAVEFARLVDVMASNGLRAAEAACTDVRSERPIAATGDAPPGHCVWLACAGAKGPNAQEQSPFVTLTSTELTPVDGGRTWLAGWARRRGGPHLVPFVRRSTGASFRVLGGVGISVDWARAGDTGSAALILELVLDFLGYDRPTRLARRLTGHGPRHFLPDVARALGYGIEFINELGRWSLAMLAEHFLAVGQEAATRWSMANIGPVQQTAGRTASVASFRSGGVQHTMGVRYSSGSAAEGRELQLRTSVYASLRDWIRRLAPDRSLCAVFALTTQEELSPVSVLIGRPAPGGSSLLVMPFPDGDESAAAVAPAPAHTWPARQQQAAADAGFAVVPPVSLDGTRPGLPGRDEEFDTGDDHGPDETLSDPESPASSTHSTTGEEMACEGCHMLDDEETMLICDDCGLAWHKDCLDTPLRKVPEDNEKWYCEACLDEDEDLPLSQRALQASLRYPTH